MATSIFFTESKDFKLIKDRILNHEDNYLVYVYADTSNIRIPRELIMELPKYGNNLIWVDTFEMDATDLSHHIVLTIGQLINPEEEIDFYIVSKSSKLEKTIIFLRNQGIPAEMIAPAQETVKPEKTKGTGRRGRPRKAAPEAVVAPAKTGKRGRPKKEKPVNEAVVAPAKTGKRGRPKKEKPVVEVVEAAVKTGKRGRPKKVQADVAPVAEVAETPKKKRGRPSIAKVAAPEALPVEPKKRGRKKIEKPVVEEKAEAEVKPKRGRKPSVKKEKTPAKKASKKAKEVKAVKPRKERVDKEITEEMVQEKLQQYATTDTNLSMVMSKLFGLKKVARPKFEAKLIDMIKLITLEDDTVAEQIANQLQEMQILQSTGPGGRVFYRD